MRARFMRRMALAAVAILVLVIVGAFTLLSAAASALGLVHPDGLVGPWSFPFVFPVLIVVAVLLFARTFRGVASPVGDLIEAAGRLESGRYDARVPERGPRELRSLAHAFNAMATRLEADESLRRQLLADVTHELRTPLTIMQGNIEALVDGVRPLDREHIALLLDDTKVLARLVDDLRTLSLAESGVLSLDRDAVDIAAVARDVVRALADQAHRAQVALGSSSSGRTVADADWLRVREVLVNLVTNALRYTPPAGYIAIDVRETADGVEVAVRDTGSGIAPDAVDGIFDRFSRSTDSPGAGLGLAIAKGLVEAHGGTIRAYSAPGQGTRIVFTLPAARS